MEVKYLNNSELHRGKWDDAIGNANNGNLYASSWYLDIVSPGWSALILPDYSMVMPLTTKRKYGFHYIFRPLLCQQLGVFSPSDPGEKEIGEFINSIPKKFRLIQYCLNSQNKVPQEHRPIMHSTFELNLNQAHEALRSSYSDNHRRNIKKGERMNFHLEQNISSESFIELLRDDVSPGSKILSSGGKLLTLISLIEEMKARDAAYIPGILNRDGKLLAAVLFGKSHKTWYYLVPVSSEEGKAGRSIFLLIDDLINKRSGNNETLDFEGSDIPGLAKFYSGFGAGQVSYPEIRKNTLPWPVKLLK